MQEQYLKMARVAGWCLLAAAAVSYAYSYSRFVEKTYPTKTFSVDGTGEIDTTPDVASFSVSVASEGGQNVSEVQQANTLKMNAITDFIKEQGVEKKDIKTMEYNLAPRYSYQPCKDGICPSAVITGYTLTQTLGVKVRDTERLGGLLSGVVEKGANAVSQVKFVVDDDEAARAAARVEAIGKAQIKAGQIAKAGGFKVGKILSLYENTDPSPFGDSPVGLGGGEMAKVVNVAPTPEPGVTTTKVQVTLTYEIAD